jgi:acetyltransferase-like isoleucine patch superfamily enzyme
MTQRFKKWQKPEFNENGVTKWGWKCQHHQNLNLGNYVDVGAFTYINAENNVSIEDNVQIGSHCSIYSISTIDNKEGPVKLKENCRIGSHSVVMPNVTVGENSIVGAFSFVNKDIPKNVVAFGVPVKVMRKMSLEEVKNLREDVDDI